MATATPARWYTHGWNSETSWKLLLGILPRTPRALRPLLHVGATAVCFSVMGDERRAAARNLRRITGERGARGLWMTWRLFYNFSKFMAAYCELPPHGDGAIEARLIGEGLGPLGAVLDAGHGAIVVGMHLGQWELALSALARAGFPVTMVMRREDESVSRFARESREASGIRVLYAGESPYLFVELLAQLRRNGVVAMQGDRELDGRSFTVSLCGGDVRIPAGPWELASRSGAPLVPGVLVFEGHRLYRLVWGEPIRVAPPRQAPPQGARQADEAWSGSAPGTPEPSLRGEGEGPVAAARAGSSAATALAGASDGETDPAVLARAMESLIRRFPDQWFNFYEVWPDREVADARP